MPWWCWRRWGAACGVLVVGGGAVLGLWVVPVRLGGVGGVGVRLGHLRPQGFLASHGVVVALVSVGGAMGGGAIDSPAGCAGSDADGVGAVAAVLWSLVHRGFSSSRVSVTLMVGRHRRCWWVWVRVWEVFGLFWALWAGFPAGADHCLLAKGDVAGGVSAGAAAGFECRCGLGCGVSGWRRRWVA